MTKQQKQLMIFLPIFNLLIGVSIDLHAPALPDISKYFHTSEHMAQLTITILIIGLAIGQFFAGFLSDYFGRYKTTIISLSTYIIATIFIIFAKSITDLLTFRFIEGLMGGFFAVNSRAIAMEKFKGNDFKLSIIYISLAWSMGIIISPFLGGLIDTYINWQALFIVMFVYAILLLIFAINILDKDISNNKSIKQHLIRTKEIALNKTFLLRSSILGLCFSLGLIFNILAPFWVSNIFKQSPSVFGMAAFILGIGYFLGTYINKYLIAKISANKLIMFGLIISIISSIVLFLYGVHCSSIYIIAINIAYINFGSAFIYSNIAIENMLKCSNGGGIFTALQGSILLIIGFFVSLLITILNHPSIKEAGIIFFSIIIFITLIFIFLRLFKKKLIRFDII